MTLVEMGMELPGVRTALNLDRALSLLDSLQPAGSSANLGDDDDEEDGGA